MTKSIENLKREFTGIRTGKANPGLLENVKVMYYGQTVPLKQVASIAVPEPRLITVQPWEKTLVPEVEKSIQGSDLGLNPQSDGTVIRLPIPPLTEDRRKDLVKVVRRFGERSEPEEPAADGDESRATCTPPTRRCPPAASPT